jgi:hypothetical protein
MDCYICRGCHKPILFQGRVVNKNRFHNHDCWLLFCKEESNEKSESVSEMSNRTDCDTTGIRNDDKVQSACVQALPRRTAKHVT